MCVRQDLLQWLKRETDERGATIVYATHIFDGLDDWPTDVMYLTDKGECEWQVRRPAKSEERIDKGLLRYSRTHPSSSLMP